MSTYSTIHSQRSMFCDKTRNAYYQNALRNAVTPKSVILDLGAGLGELGMIALSEGADKVYLVEPASVADITEIIVKENGLKNQVTCIKGKIEDVELPEKVDVIISVFTGNFLLSEDLLPSLFYARDKYLREGGRLIPDRAKMFVSAVCMPEFYEKHIDCWIDTESGIDYSKVRDYAVNSIYAYRHKNKNDLLILSPPAELVELDFMQATNASCHSTVEIEITQDGTLHGWLGWFDARMGEKWLSTSPLGEKMHWGQIFLPMEHPLEVKQGTVIVLTIDRPEFGEWSWFVEVNGKKEKHSTFLSEPISIDKVTKLSNSYIPKLSKKQEPR